MATQTSKPQRVDVGFSGGQALALRLEADAYRSLKDALTGDHEQRGWLQLETHDSELLVDLAEVVYVRLDTERERIGF